MPDLFDLPAGDADIALLDDMLARAPKVFVKKVSNNDRDWADNPKKHQQGVYMPVAEREAGFFPALARKERPDPKAKEIRETYFRTEWPQTGEFRDDTHLVHYTSKGEETHLTRLPRSAFRNLSPASWVVMAPLPSTRPAYECMTIDSTSAAADRLMDRLGLDPDFTVGILDPRAIADRERDLLLDFAEEVSSAWMNGDIAAFAAAGAGMPTTADLARQAREKFLLDMGLPTLDPWTLDAPGDAIRQISRVIEWDLFREAQRRERALELVRAVFGDVPSEPGMRGVIRKLVDATAQIDKIMLSASQQRKSRAGYSFEHQIQAMLGAGGIPFVQQVVIDAAKRRPDFVLPSLNHLNRKLKGPQRGLILSAKTTLRERWKQVEREMRKRNDLFLATVDETVAGNVIGEMAALNICLVVPETLKASRDTEYARHANVIDFATFFHSELRDRRVPAWSRMGQPE